MRLGLLLLIPLFLLLSACNNDVPAITKIDSPNEKPSSTPELVEDKELDNQEEKLDLVLEFKLPNEQVSINLDGVSILREYLSNEENREDKIDNMRLIPLEVPDYDTLYLLQFSCNNTYCSYLLLDKNEDGRSYLVSDIARFRKAIISPDNNKLLLIFERQEEENNQARSKNKLVVMDLNKWSKLSFKDNDSINYKDYQMPLQEVVWKDDETLQVRIPNIESAEELSNWYDSEQIFKQIELSINTDI